MVAKWINRLPSVPPIIRLPDSMKNGIASSGKLCVGWKIFTTAATLGMPPTVTAARPELITSA